MTFIKENNILNWEINYYIYNWYIYKILITKLHRHLYPQTINSAVLNLENLIKSANKVQTEKQKALKLGQISVKYGVREIWTLAGIAPPKSLAGTPLHQLEYHSKKVLKYYLIFIPISQEKKCPAFTAGHIINLTKLIKQQQN